MELAVFHGADVNTVSREVFQKYNQRREKKEIEQEATALHVACYNGQVHIVSFLLEANADVHFPHSAKYTPFYYAMRLQDPERKAITELLIKGGTQYSSRNPDRLTLHAALKASFWPVMETILSNRHFLTGPHGQVINNMAEAVSERGSYSALHFISISGDAAGIAEAVPKLLAAGAPLDHVADGWNRPPGRNAGTPLVHAAKMHNWAAATALVEAGAQLDATSNPQKQEIVLQIALRDSLLEPEDDMRPLDELRRDHELHQQFVRAFVRKARETNRLDLIENRPITLDRGWQGTPLWYAAERAADYNCMKILLEEGSASARATVKRLVEVNEDDGFERMAEVTILRGLLPPFPSPFPPSADAGVRLEDRVQLLIEHGARLDAEVDQVNVSSSVASSSTVLDTACASCRGEREHWLFDVILRSATNNNVSLEHVTELEQKYGGETSVLVNLEELRRRLN
jgi:ankyrin repeat protein